MARRILLHGVTGSGKSTAALAIGRRTGLPVTLVDDLTWDSGWRSVSVGQRWARIEPIISTDKWVLDTAYSAWREDVVARANLIVGLDYPRVVLLPALAAAQRAPSTDSGARVQRQHRDMERPAQP